MQSFKKHITEGKNHPAADELNAYAKKHGGIDKKDFQVAAGKLNNFKATGSPKAVADLVRMLNNLDTDPMEKILVTIKKHDPSMARSLEKKMGIHIREEAEELDEISKDLAGRYKAAATKDKEIAGRNTERHVDRGNYEKAGKEIDRQKKRISGIEKANKRLNKEEVELDEDTGKYKATSEKSKFGKGGYRPHLKNPEGKTSYMAGVSYKTHDHAAGEAAAYHKGYTSGPGKANERGAERAVAAYRAKHKQHMHEEFDLTEEQQYDLVEAYLLENNIDADSLSIEQLDEIIGKVIGGAFKAAAKTAVGAGRIAKKAANRMSTAGRADAAEKRADAAEKRNKDRDRIRKAQERLQKAREAARNK